MLIIHSNRFEPTLRPVTPDEGSDGIVTVALPEITAHVPVPIAGVFPASVAVVAHTVWSGPASAIVGGADLVIVTVSLEEGHVALLIVHTKEFAPTESPVTPEPGLDGVVTEALPAMTVHVPVPVAGAFPARVAVVAHTVSSGPASAVVGEASLVIVTVSLVEPQPGLLTVQTNVLAPTDNAVTPDAGLAGVVTDALPAITVHDPVPTAGALAARLVVAAQTVWSGPASASEG